MNSEKKQQGKRQRHATSLPNVVGAITAVSLLAIGLFPALASVRRSSKNGACLTNLMQIGYANTVYASQDPADMALPVHRMQFCQCPLEGICNPPAGCSDPIYVGAYEWGGKSGVGRTDNILFPGSANPLNSKYGTKAGFGPNTRPLNTILYPQAFPDFGGIRPGPYGLEFLSMDEIGALADTKLDLPLNRCPADTGYTGAHCPDFAQRGLTSYDHFGTSYNANLFMTASMGGGNPMFSNSPYLHRMSDILSPSTTLAYQENNGRFAWAAAPDPCSFIVGVPGTVRGWHGKEWTFNAAFIDGHAETVYMRGYKNPDVGRYPEGGSFFGFACIIIRGDGWQIDTLPLPTAPTQLISAGGGRPSYEGCVSPEQSGRAASPVSSSSGTTCQTAGEPGCAAR